MKINGTDSAKMLVEMLKNADNFSVCQNETDAVKALRYLFDNQSFVRLSAFMTRSLDSCEEEGVICAYGSVKGKPVFAFAQDASKCGGAVEHRQAKKIASLYKRAIQNGAPVVAFLQSVGGSIDEGSRMLSAYGELIDCVSSAKGVVPQIAIVCGNCTGMLATVASLFDFTVGTKNAGFSFIPQSLLDDDVSSDTYLEENGTVCKMCDDVKSATAFARDLISFLPQNCNDSKFLGDNDDDINRPITTVKNGNYDIQELIKDIADNNAFVELYEKYAPSVRTGFLLLGGIVCAVVANDKNINFGAITASGCRKMTRTVKFCSSFGIPILTLADTKGIEVAAENEKDRLPEATAELALAYSISKCPKITVILGRAFGAGFTLMGSRSLGADEVLATRDAIVSAMPPESAVAFMENDNITLSNDRKSLEADYIAENCNAAYAAANGDIDDIIDPILLRAHVCTAVDMFSSKSDI